ncbi:MAG: hypothetical protein Q9213_006738 [Squamulea squamosa]
MTSSVFFRFKSQKEPTRVAFDGTGISVFELKREIILSNRLGDGSDFELVISSEDTGEEYDDDTHLIPRSTAVIAKRLPAFKPGRGGAARYVSGKMPQNAKTPQRTDSAAGHAGAASRKMELSKGLPDMNGAQTEEEKIAAMFKLGADQWAQQQQEMANATPVHRSGPSKSKQINVPDRPPPPGYVCYRCGEKGHWIQACPTNDDPAYINRPRVKRTTGIPRSFLKTVEKPTAIANDGTVDETKQPAGVMINAEGEWVVAEPDKASWDQYQARAKISAAAQEEAARGDRVLQEKGLECPIDKRLFIEPASTPCCKKTFCLECITNALLDNDLKCPHCATENVPVDDLTPDEEMAQRIRDHEQEQQASRPPKGTNTPRGDSPSRNDASKSTMEEDAGAKTEPLPDASVEYTKALEPSSVNSPAPERPNSQGAKGAASKKRPAESSLSNTRVPPGPTQEIDQQAASRHPLPAFFPSVLSNSGMAKPMESMSQPVPADIVNMSMGMIQPLPMGGGMYNSMSVANPHMGGGNSTNWNAFWTGAFPQQPLGVMGRGFSNGASNGQFSTQYMHLPMHNGYMGQNGTGANAYGRGAFPNQQRNHFAGSKANEEDSAYFRKPVNPHRHPARRRPRTTEPYEDVTAVSEELSQASKTNNNEGYLTGQTSHLRCARCAIDLCPTSQIISKGFTGRHGRAYLVSAAPVTGPASYAHHHQSRNAKRVCLPNTRTHKAMPRQLVTGAHTVSDVSCAFCGSVIGWKYDSAEEETQRYKVGKYILETKKVFSSSCWENNSEEADEVLKGCSSAVDSHSWEDLVEFDSQDEDECEDLFAGVWSPALAIRRRQGKRFGRSPGE